MIEDTNKVLIDTVYLDNYNYSFEQLKTAYCQILSLREVLNEPQRKFLVEHDNVEPRKRFDISDDGFKDLSNSLILHNKFTLTAKDLNIIKKVMIPGENERCTSSYYWTVKYANQKIECNQKGGERWGILKEYLEMNHCM